MENFQNIVDKEICRSYKVLFSAYRFCSRRYLHADFAVMYDNIHIYIERIYIFLFYENFFMYYFYMYKTVIIRAKKHRR